MSLWALVKGEASTDLKAALHQIVSNASTTGMMDNDVAHYMMLEEVRRRALPLSSNAEKIVHKALFRQDMAETLPSALNKLF